MLETVRSHARCWLLSLPRLPVPRSPSRSLHRYDTLCISFCVSTDIRTLPAPYVDQPFTFAPPSAGPLVATANYTGASNSTLTNSPVVKGQVFDRFIQVWLENTDFDSAASTVRMPTLAFALKGLIFALRTYRARSRRWLSKVYYLISIMPLRTHRYAPKCACIGNAKY
jgi:hypothetical protein